MWVICPDINKSNTHKQCNEEIITVTTDERVQLKDNPKGRIWINASLNVKSDLTIEIGVQQIGLRE